MLENDGSVNRARDNTLSPIQDIKRAKIYPEAQAR